MTSTLQRPSRGLPATAPPVGVLRAGLPSALWAATVGLVLVTVPILLGWLADSRGGAGAADALATAAQVWLLAHGAALLTPSGPVDLVPLGLTLLPVTLLHRAGRHAAAQRPVADLPDAARLTAAVALPYAFGVGLLSLVAVTPAVTVSVEQALTGGLLIGTVAAGLGVLRQAGLWSNVRQLCPNLLREAAVGGTAALLVLLGAGALVAAGVTAAHGGRSLDFLAGTEPGLVGGALVVLGTLAVLPVAVVWGACWLVGPGFAVGSGTAVGPFDTHLSAVPSLPLLAGLPASGPPTWLGVLSLAVPLAAGALAGLLVLRRGGGWAHASLAGPVAGLGLWVLASAASGPLGAGRLSDVGPAPWSAGLALAVEVTGGALLAVGGQRLLARRTARASADA